MLIPDSELTRVHDAYLREQAAQQATVPKTKAQILVEVVQEDPTLTVKELAEASGMSATWVRRTLKLAGITLAKAVRPKRTRVTGSTRCTRPGCGHPRGTTRGRLHGSPSHCAVGSLHFDAADQPTYCAKAHCLAYNLINGVRVPCECPEFVAPTAEVKP